MKVTTIIPDKIINEVKQLAGGDDFNESLLAALEEWISLKKIKQLNKDISSKPIGFFHNYSAEKVRDNNRQK